MLARLEKPSFLSEDSPETSLEALYYCLFCGFLTGRLPPYADFVLDQTFVVYGGELALRAVRPSSVTTDAVNRFVQETIEEKSTLRELSRISLPHLAKTVDVMDTADFEQARRDYPFVDLVLCAAYAIGGPAREIVTGLSSLGGANRPSIAAVFLPLLFDARRLYPEQLDADLPVALKLRETFERDGGDEERQAILTSFLKEKVGQLLQMSS